jgi:uncharacterized membrane protein YedE/YeeE
MYQFASFLCGLLFGLGLTISHMIDPNKIMNFLDIMGNWDPSLALVMLSALITTTIGYRIILKKNRPQLTEKFCLPEKKNIDMQLIVGASLFGIGWGLAGYCPGPAITALGLGIMDAFYFVLGMILGSLVYLLLPKKIRN